MSWFLTHQKYLIFFPTTARHDDHLSEFRSLQATKLHLWHWPSIFSFSFCRLFKNDDFHPTLPQNLPVGPSVQCDRNYHLSHSFMDCFLHLLRDWWCVLLWRCNFPLRQHSRWRFPYCRLLSSLGGLHIWLSLLGCQGQVHQVSRWVDQGHLWYDRDQRSSGRCLGWRQAFLPPRCC